MKRFVLLLLVILVVTGISLADVDPLHVFTSGTPALASEVNENFQILVDAANDQIALTAGLNPATANGGDLLYYSGTSWVTVAANDMYRDIDNMQPFLAVNYIIALTGTFPSRNSSEPFLGEISMFGGNFAPRGWALCDGQLLPISQNQALFSLLGTTYGGDGRTTFALPDLRGRVPMHAGNGPGLSPRALGSRGGTETQPVIR